MKYIFYFLLFVNIVVAIVYRDKYFPHLATSTTTTYTHNSALGQQTAVYDCLHIVNLTDTKDALRLVEFLHQFDVRARIVSTRAKPVTTKLTVINEFVLKVQDNWGAIQVRFPYIKRDEHVGLRCELPAV